MVNAFYCLRYGYGNWQGLPAIYMGICYYRVPFYSRTPDIQPLYPGYPTLVPRMSIPSYPRCPYPRTPDVHPLVPRISIPSYPGYPTLVPRMFIPSYPGYPTLVPRMFIPSYPGYPTRVSCTRIFIETSYPGYSLTHRNPDIQFSLVPRIFKYRTPDI